MIISVTTFADKKDKLKGSISELSPLKKIEFEYSFIDGVRHKIIGDQNSAIHCFQNCLKLLPESASVKYEIAGIYAVDKNWDNALQFAQEAVSCNSNNIWYKILLANILQNKSMIEEACKIYASIIEKYSHKEEFYIIEAQLYSSIGKWEEAIKVYKSFEDEFGISEDVSIEIIKLYTKLNNVKKATSELVKLINRYPDKSEYLSLLAELYFNYNEDKKGLKILDDLLKSDNKNGYVYFYLSDYYIDKKNIVEADKNIRSGICCDNINNEIKIKYILKLIFQQDTSLIKLQYIDTYMDLLVNRYQEDLGIRALHSDYLRSKGQLVQAKHELEYIVSKDNENFLVWEDLLLLCNEIQDTVGLYHYSENAINFFPEQPLPYLFIGMKYFSINEFKTALCYLNKGLVLAPENSMLKVQFYFYLAECYYLQNKVEACFKMYDCALEIDPNNAVILNNYAYYLSLRQENLSKAERMSSQAVKIEPDNSTWLDTYAWVLYMRGNYSQARFYMKLALENLVDIPSVYYDHYGDILFKNGEKEEALKMWKNAFDKGMTDEKQFEILKLKINTGKLPE